MPAPKTAETLLEKMQRVLPELPSEQERALQGLGLCLAMLLRHGFDRTMILRIVERALVRTGF